MKKINHSYAGWKVSNKQKYLEINAEDHYHFGLLRGQYLKDQIKTTNRLIKSFAKVCKIPFNKFLENSEKYIIPDENKSEIQGLAEGSGLKYEQILLQKTWIDIYYGILQPSIMLKKNIGACTSIAIKNKKNRYVHGQTMDFGLAFFPTINWVKYKISEKNTAFCLSLGCHTFPVGVNKDITLTINLVQTCDVGEFGIPESIKAQIAFENYNNPLEVFKIMTQSYCGGWNYIYSDKKKNIFALETKPFANTIRYLNNEGYIVKTNTFKTQVYKPSLIDPSYSLQRQKKAEQLIEEQTYRKKKFKINDGKKIFCYNDGTEASICRISESNNYFDTVTEGYLLTNNKNVFFGIGNQTINTWGKFRRSKFI